MHLWRIFQDQPPAQVEQLASTLSADERQRAERFYFERDRRHYMVSRGALRAILGRYLNLEASRLRFDYSPRGKPALAGTPELGEGRLHFNLAHSHGLALAGFTWRPLGVDLERLRPMNDLEQIAERFFSVQERAVLLALPPDQRQEAFFNCWTRKEAYLKATGEGLARPLDQFDVSLAPGEPAKLLNVAGDLPEAGRWSMWALVPAPGYAGALLVEGHGWQIKCWHWPDYVTREE